MSHRKAPRVNDERIIGQEKKVYSSTFEKDYDLNERALGHLITSPAQKIKDFQNKFLFAFFCSRDFAII